MHEATVGVRAGSLFSGVGGLDLGLSMSLGCEPAWFCEIDKHCVSVLNRHWPDVPVLPDVRDTDALAAHGPIDVLHGGYPCQPFSHAGNRNGENDPRHLWPSFASAIRVLRPRFVIGENVAGHLSLGFAQVLADLAEMGFDVRWGVVRASDAGAPHERSRLFWIAAAHADGDGSWPANVTGAVVRVGSEDARETFQRERAWPLTRHRGAKSGSWGCYSAAISNWEHVAGTPPAPTGDDGMLSAPFVEWMMGFPVGWTDGPAPSHRLRILGNAVVPAQAALAMRLLTAKEAA